MGYLRDLAKQVVYKFDFQTGQRCIIGEPGEDYDLSTLVDRIEQALVKAQIEMSNKTKRGIYRNKCCGNVFRLLGVAQDYKLKDRSKFVVIEWLTGCNLMYTYPYDEFIKIIDDGSYTYVGPD